MRPKGTKDGVTRGRIYLALKKEAYTARELGELIGIDERNVHAHIRKLKKLGIVRIESYVPNAFGHTRCYRAGTNPDAPKPPPLSKSEMNKKTWQKYHALKILKKRKETATPWTGLL